MSTPHSPPRPAPPSTPSATRSPPAATACRRRPSSACRRRCCGSWSRNPRAAERKQVAQLLGLWDTRLLCAIAGGGLERFTSPVAGRARARAALVGRQPPAPAARRVPGAAQGRAARLLRQGGANGDRNPVWDAIGYPGPLGPPSRPAAARRSSRPRSPATLTLDCDVVVVGSGAGGGTAAAVLAQAGLDVRDRRGGALLHRARLRRRRAVRLRPPLRQRRRHGQRRRERRAAGRPGAGRHDARQLHVLASARPTRCAASGPSNTASPAVATEDFDRSLDAVWERIGVNAEHSVPSRRDETIREGLDKLGWEWEVMQRNVRGCTEEVCRLCHYGCQLGAKQSTLKTWVQDAHDAGARILVETARRAGADRGRRGERRRGTHRRRARGDRAGRARWSAPAARCTRRCCWRARASRSNALGKHLRLHPVLVIWGQFDEPVRPWEGMLSSTYSDQDADMDGDGYGVKYEHVATPPSILLSFSPWRGGRQHAELMQALPYTGGLGALLRDHGVGEVRTGSDGEPVVRYKLTPDDVEHMRRGVRGAAQVVEAMGARRIYSSHSKLGRLRAGPRGDLDGFMRDADACGWGAGQAQIASRSTSWAAPASAARRSTRSAIPTGQVWGTPGLYVFDGVGVPDGVRGQPDGHDRGAGAHERPRPGRKAGRGCLRPARRRSSSARARTGWPPRSRWRGPGRRVRVLEAEASARRRRRSAELTLPGFVHDVCSAVHPLGARLAVPPHPAARRARARAGSTRRRRSRTRSTTARRSCSSARSSRRRAASARTRAPTGG